jgi:hypothetical protein
MNTAGWSDQFESADRIFPCDAQTKSAYPAETGVCVVKEGVQVVDLNKRISIDLWKWQDISNIVGHSRSQAGYGSLETFEVHLKNRGKLSFACADLQATLQVLGSGKNLSERSAGEFLVYTWQDPSCNLPAEVRAAISSTVTGGSLYLCLLNRFICNQVPVL